MEELTVEKIAEAIVEEVSAPVKNKGGRPKGRKDSHPRRTKGSLDREARLTAISAAKRKEKEEYGYASVTPRGTSKNKEVQKLKDALARFLSSDEEIESLKDELHALSDPKDRIWARKELMQYVLPKVNATDLNANVDVTSVGDELELLTRTNAGSGASLINPEETETEDSQDNIFS